MRRIGLCLPGWKNKNKNNMKVVGLILGVMLWAGVIVPLYAQEDVSDVTTYQVETFGSAATGDNTPFWMVSNRYGVVPLDAGNGYFRGGVFHQHRLGHSFTWSVGVDLAFVAPRERNVFLQQLYAELVYQKLVLSIGSKERYISLWDRFLSSGDLIQSPNARPIPEINISLPEFVVVPFLKGWLQLKGDMGIGRSFDSRYLADVISPDKYYVEDVLWHHKSIFVRLKDTRGDFPFTVSFGVQHTAQWGGNSTNPNLGKQPHSFKDFLRVFAGKSGGGDASPSAQTNVLGNHHISYDFQLGYTQKTWAVHAYHQHLSADKSGLLLYNGWDGLWGVQLDVPQFSWIRKVVLEYLMTKDQSGPLHYLYFDHDRYPGRGGGADNYYNNEEYTTGHTYFNRSIGSPLIVSPEYNSNRFPGFENNRVKDWHIGLEGDLSRQLSYRLLCTVMNGWGTPFAPLLKKRDGVSLALDLSYQHPRLSGWDFKGSVGFDTGDMVGDKTVGFGLSVRKRGVLKAWNK
ncbi:capsule assembly Wzi family protein [Parabacteroides sp. PF5-9]|uniref:capsule assembly Wzi family protein n=1 Tax=Parabacteroides sp. PF5-9 TaxID=1742404 RepID=UPI002473E92B|nr:capsule assembly Wzi family protein [Parabacteroides sp. PF5-9]MDH6357672.1 hypothetical protein [Parabacteroides sp. PF5-9]